MMKFIHLSLISFFLSCSTVASYYVASTSNCTNQTALLFNSQTAPFSSLYKAEKALGVYVDQLCNGTNTFCKWLDDTAFTTSNFHISFNYTVIQKNKNYTNFTAACIHAGGKFWTASYEISLLNSTGTIDDDGFYDDDDYYHTDDAFPGSTHNVLRLSFVNSPWCFATSCNLTNIRDIVGEHSASLYGGLVGNYTVFNVSTAKPSTGKPITAQPITSKPVTAQPVTSKPITAKPVTSKPVTASKL
mmetsp:Transcript_3372/g.4990  ORF Transcript_3372/g.4990 Transcript_3372/m.4990 type:complete len:245 (+) Transcript_3372:297-1031(+)